MANGDDKQGLFKRVLSGVHSGLSNPAVWSVLFVVVVLLILAWLLWSGSRPVVDQLPNQEFARGIITLVFVLFTIAFAALVVIHGLFFSAVDKDDRRFSRGREVLGLFIGIVGTIVGFYFGAAEKPSENLDVAVQAQRQEATTNVTVTAVAVGGTSPYRFDISVGSKRVTDVPITSDDGWLSITVEGDNANEVTIEASDAKDLHAVKKVTIQEAKSGPE